jgi:FkbM family methyltransferase
MINFNRLANLEDFTDPAFLDVLREVFKHEVAELGTEFPKGMEHRKHWEIVMAVLAFRHFGVLRPDSVVLGVGAGTETTIYYLTNHVKQVFATDLYYTPGVWNTFAPSRMLAEPDKFAPYAYERQRLIVQHMDGRSLEFEDNTFDAIFSSGSIEHFGGFQFVANAAYEMGRVLKPGGILALSTEYLISGPPGGKGWDPGTLLLSAEDTQKYIVEASGLEPVDEPDFTLSEATLASDQELLPVVLGMQEYMKAQGEYPQVMQAHHRSALYPFLVLSQEGYKFCSVHLTLKKTGQYPACDNSWAKPSESTYRAIEETSAALTAPTPAESQTHSQPLPDHSPDNSPLISHLHARLDEFVELRSDVLFDPLSRKLPGFLGRAYRAIRRVIGLGKAWEMQKNLHEALILNLQRLDKKIDDLAVEARYEALTLNDQRLDKKIDDLAVEARYEALMLNGQKIEKEIAALAEGQGKIRNQMKFNSFQLDLLDQTIAFGESRGADAATARINARDFVELLTVLEHEMPELAEATAVEFSVRGTVSEDIIFSGTSYMNHHRDFESDRFPKDVWYHVDLSEDLKGASIYDDLSGTLKPGGHLILITRIDDDTVPDTRGLSLRMDRRFMLSPDLNIRVLVLQVPAVTACATKEGFTLLVDPADPGPIRWSLENFEIWDPEETDFLKSALHRGDVFIDVGANIGYFTLLGANQVGPTGHVYALEPDPTHTIFLRWNIRSLENSSIVTVIEAAASNTAGSSILYRSPVNLGDHRLFPTQDDVFDEGKVRESIPVKTVTIDEVIPADTPVDLVKIDTQGFEVAVLEGMRQIIARHHPVILFEMWPYGLRKAGYEPAAPPSMLVEAGYRLYKLGKTLEPISSIQETIASVEYPQAINLVGLVDK